MNRLSINNTNDYHREELDTLGWEFTLCNMLESRDSPLQSILKKKGTFGTLLVEYFGNRYRFGSFSRILEVGGGHGYLMRDLLRKYRDARGTMLDISPYLINKQKRTLTGLDVECIQRDFFQMERRFFSRFDAVFLNENAGDFETVSGPVSLLEEQTEGNDITASVGELAEKYHLIPAGETEFILNTGAITAVEKLCSEGIGFIYLGEHSCEATPPGELEEYLGIKKTGVPEKIELKGHNEYTIRFSDLVAVAESFDYRVERGSYADFIQPEVTDRLMTVIRSNINSDRHEIIRHFMHDLYKYEYLVLSNEKDRQVRG